MYRRGIATSLALRLYQETITRTHRQFFWGSPTVDLVGWGAVNLDEASTVVFSQEIIEKALKNIYHKKVNVKKEIEPELWAETVRLFNLATATGLSDAVDEGTAMPSDGFMQALKTNNEVFSAFRTHRMQNDIAARMTDEKGHLKSFSQFAKDVKPYTDHQNRAWLQTEYSTAVVRAHRAADWQQFEAERDVLPNLEWMPSTSPNPGADHREFWGTILPIDHPFWNEHKPGDRWNCKCSLRNTDKKASATIPTGGENDQPARGLENNPGKDAKFFSDKHAYFPNSCSSCPFAGNKLAALFANLKGGKNCYECGKVEKATKNVTDEQAKRIRQNRAEYNRLKADKDYIDVEFEKKIGGVKGTHTGHNFDKKGGKYEITAQNVGYKNGHSVILENEYSQNIGERFCEGYWDKQSFEVAGAETGTSNNIKKAINHCASKPNVEVAVVVLPKNNFTIDDIKKAINRYEGLEKAGGKGYVKFKEMYFIDSNEKIIYKKSR